MKTLWIPIEMKYDGAQLRPLYAYLNHQVQGDSIISWVGPCDISKEKMIDGEDLLEGSLIQGSRMLHFIIEVFHQDLMTGVSLQRLFAAIAKDYLEEKSQFEILRSGDDLYFKGGKISISIASLSTVSAMIHFAMNVSNQGTPVQTASLEDLKLEPQIAALDLMSRFQKEFDSIVIATQKVRPLV
jgi:hypothetical protein